MNIKLTLAVVVSVLALWPARASAATYEISPGTLTRLSGAGCTVDFAYNTRPDGSSSIAVAKIKYVSPSTCHASTYVQTIGVENDTWLTLYGPSCFINPDTACAESGGWSVSKLPDSTGIGAFLYLCSAAGVCQDHLVVMPE